MEPSGTVTKALRTPMYGNIDVIDVIFLFLLACCRPTTSCVTGGFGCRMLVALMLRPVHLFRSAGTDGGYLQVGGDVSVGDRVAVEGKGNGVVRFVGLHAENGKPRIGVELDDPVGKNNGTVKVCGVLCPLYARPWLWLSCPSCPG